MKKLVEMLLENLSTKDVFLFRIACEPDNVVTEKQSMGQGLAWYRFWLSHSEGTRQCEESNREGEERQ